jgi:hypothetical protein
VVLGLVRSLTACSGESDGDTSESQYEDIGVPCILEDESQPDFSGSSQREMYAGGTTLDECDSGVCLANHFQGRVSCPYGQTTEQAASDPTCFVPGANEPVTVAVDPQLLSRPAATTMTCSCQCGGPGAGPFCNCPSGTVCETTLPITGDPNAPMYCVVERSVWDPTAPPSPEVCIESDSNCGDPRPYPPP